MCDTYRILIWDLKVIGIESLPWLLSTNPIDSFPKRIATFDNGAAEIILFVRTVLI